MSEATATASDQLKFTTRVRPVTYGDDKTFHEYKLVFWMDGAVVGVECGPRRESTTAVDARRAARQRLEVLRAHRLFAIKVTNKHIHDGIARDCHRCAVAFALWDNQERMGLDFWAWSFRVESYVAFASADGLVLEGNYKTLTLPDMPEVVTLRKHIDGFDHESMVEWTEHWDEWADYRCLSRGERREWRRDHGYEPEYYPDKPHPCSFVLDMDAFKSEDAE